MNLEHQVLFLFSAFGALNGFFLSLYFAFFSKKKDVSNYFLSALLFVLSIRIIKSVFFYFNPKLSEVFIQIGISACALIGPFLFLYVRNLLLEIRNKNWLLHIIPAIIIIITLGILYPYWENKTLWSRYIIKIIYFQWLIYIILTGFYLKVIFNKLISKNQKLKQLEIWVISIFIGIVAIWIAYNIGSYSSYIVGALSFSFVFYLFVLLWVFKIGEKVFFIEESIKYVDKKIGKNEADAFRLKLNAIIYEKELFKNPDLKLADIANTINVTPHYVSQFLNDNLGKSFPLFINEYRIESAKHLLITETKYTTEAIGYECGFNSKSTFYTTFKKIVGVTPANYKKQV
jgi:AraC-like DNA-binding protein